MPSVARKIMNVIALVIAVAGPGRATVPNSVDLFAIGIDRNILDEHDPFMASVKYGAEGGEVLRDRHGLYHWFTSEQFSDPYWVMNRIAHWTSSDGLRWARDSSWTKEGNHDTTGTRDKSNYFDPTLAYDSRSGFWYMFYVAYRQKGDVANRALIYRAKAVRRGPDGLSGPFHDNDADDVVVLGPRSHPAPYEASWIGTTNWGLGADSVTLYPRGRTWMMLWAENMLATARRPSSRFVRLPESPLNPVRYGRPAMTFTHDPRATPFTYEHFYLENPIVRKLPNNMPGGGTYLLVAGYYSDDRRPELRGRTTCGWATSPDGLHWSEVRPLEVHVGDCLTVLSLLPERDGSLTMYMTARERNHSNERERLSRVRLEIRPHQSSDVNP